MTEQKLVDRLRGIRHGGRVERAHGVPHHGSYSNASHSWGVAMIMWLIWPQHFPRLALQCLAHDCPEGQVGDIPAPTLRYNPDIRKMLEPLERLVAAGLGVPSEHDLSEEDHRMLKICDRLELFAWAKEQEEMGNKAIAPLILELEYYLEEKVGMPTEAVKLYLQMKEPVLYRRGGEWMEKLTQDAPD